MKTALAVLLCAGLLAGEHTTSHNRTPIVPLSDMLNQAVGEQASNSHSKPTITIAGLESTASCLEGAVLHSLVCPHVNLQATTSLQLRLYCNFRAVSCCSRLC